MVKRVEQQFVLGNELGVPGDCMRAAVASLLELPLEQVPHFVLFEDSWWAAVLLWAEAKGYAVQQSHPGYGEPQLAFGISPRGVRHAVVWHAGVTVADPHPSQMGLVGDSDDWEYWKVVKA